MEIDDLILDRIRFENPWWHRQSIDQDYEHLPRRLFFEAFLERIVNKAVRRAVVLMGPRRVGKTVMMYHAISALLKGSTDTRRIGFINVENPVFSQLSLDQIFAAIRQSSGVEDAEGWYIFLDEIQYLKDWEIQLKNLVDNYRESRFVASGSAAAILRMKSLESGAGRFTDFRLPALNFNEYLNFLGQENLIRENHNPLDQDYTHDSTDIRLLNWSFIDYLNFGGFPEILFANQAAPNSSLYIRSDIIDKVLLRDLPGLYGIENVQELYRLFSVLAYKTGSEVSYQSLSESSGINKKTLQMYISYLEASFMIRIMRRVDDTAKSFKRNDYMKIYLANPSVRTAMFAPIEPTDDGFGSLVETGIVAQLGQDEVDQPYYARWSKGRFQGEVDQVRLNRMNFAPESALEIKWSNRYVEKPEELQSLLLFCKQNGLQEATVTSIDKHTSVIYKDIKLHFTPASLYCYIVGHQQLKGLNMR